MYGCGWLLISGFGVAAFIFAMLAKQQAERTSKQLGALQAAFDQLRRELDALRGGRPAPVAETPVAAPQDVPAVEPVAAEPFPVVEAVPFVVPEPAADIPPAVESQAPPASIDADVAEEPVSEPAAAHEAAAAFEAAPPPPPPAAPARSFDWESLVGVKLFSWVAGVSLALAAVFFLKYSVEHGWLSAPVRAAIGLLTGGLLIGICELRVARDYKFTSNAMLGAGIAILYSTLFAIHSLWHLWPPAACFGGMLLVTALAVFLSVRRDSVFIALLGLLGGFATPALLSTGENRPIALFGYLLLLNLGLAWIAYTKRWPILSVASALFTVVYQWGWVAKYLNDAQMPLAAAIFAVFAIAGGSALWTRRVDESLDRTQTVFERVGLASAVVPLFFAIFAAAVPAYGSRYNVLFGFLLLVNAGLAVVAHFRRHLWLNLVGGVGALLAFALWLAFSYTPDAWPVIVGWVAAFVVLHILAGASLRGSTSLAALLLFAFAALAGLETATGEPTLFFGALFALYASVAFFASRRGDTGAFVAATVMAIVGEGVWVGVRAETHSSAAFLTAVVSIALVFLASVLRVRSRVHGGAFAAASFLVLSAHVMLMVVAASDGLATVPWPLLAALAILDVAIAIASLLLRRAGVVTAASALSMCLVIVWSLQHGEAQRAALVSLSTIAVIAIAALAWLALAQRTGLTQLIAGVPVAAAFTGFVATAVATNSALLPPSFAPVLATNALLLVVLLATAAMTRELIIATPAAIAMIGVALVARDLQPMQQIVFTGTFALIFTLFPLLSGRRVERLSHPYIAAAISHVTFLIAANDALHDLHRTGGIGLLPLAQAGIFGILLWHLLRIEPREDRVISRLALVGGTLLGFVTVAIPLQFDREWITLGWALEAAALLWLFRRIPYRGLLLWSAGLYVAVFARLVLNSQIFEYHVKSATPIWNWYLYAYLVAAAAFFVGTKLLPAGMRRSIAALATGGTLLLFVLVNIEIADFFSKGSTIAFNFFSSSLAEDLTYTIAWAIFAIGVLIAGIIIDSRGARIAALALLAVTILKCFLHDLGRLGGLYRVASLVGLAFSLVAVGVLIQRFVVARVRDERTV